MTNGRVGFANDGLMGETVIRLLLDDLKREGLSANATLVQTRMQTRATAWSKTPYPYALLKFGSCKYLMPSSGLALKWPGTRLDKKGSMRGLNTSISPARPRTVLILSLAINLSFPIGDTMATPGVIG